LKVLLDVPSFNEMELLFLNLSSGGRFSPQECVPRQRVAIIIPYRDREHHLKILLYNLHPVLIRQLIHYTIFVVEEIPGVMFNRAKLMNIGFKEALSSDPNLDCFIFHDVDLVPMDDRNP